MSSRLLAVTYEAVDPGGVASFWGTLLDRPVVPEANGALLPADGTQVGLRFVAAGADEPGPHRLHLHLTSTSLEDQQSTVATALRLGGRHLEVGQRPEESYVVLGDPEGNAFCVIEPGNNYLAGCGYLGEVTCEGSREVGLFWRDTLGWPLVWDQDEETAVQSPDGGTKVSWGGEPPSPAEARNPQHFDLATSDLPGEVDRLVSLGATRLGDRDRRVQLVDPGGNEFSLGTP